MIFVFVCSDGEKRSENTSLPLLCSMINDLCNASTNKDIVYIQLKQFNVTVEEITFVLKLLNICSIDPTIIHEKATFRHGQILKILKYRLQMNKDVDMIVDDVISTEQYDLLRFLVSSEYVRRTKNLCMIPVNRKKYDALKILCDSGCKMTKECIRKILALDNAMFVNYFDGWDVHNANHLMIENGSFNCLKAYNKEFDINDALFAAECKKIQILHLILKKVKCSNDDVINIISTLTKYTNQQLIYVEDEIVNIIKELHGEYPTVCLDILCNSASWNTKFIKTLCQLGMHLSKECVMLACDKCNIACLKYLVENNVLHDNNIVINGKFILGMLDTWCQNDYDITTVFQCVLYMLSIMNEKITLCDFVKISNVMRNYSASRYHKYSDYHGEYNDKQSDYDDKYIDIIMNAMNSKMEKIHLPSFP